MKQGDFETAWAINDIEGQHWPSAHQLWNGRPLDHIPIELEARHGLGDFVQMMRFIPTLNRLGCTVSMKVTPALRSFASCFSGDFRTSLIRDVPGRTRSLEMMELAYALRVQTAQLPVLQNYLHLPPELTERKRSQMTTSTGLPKVGVVWSGSSWDPERWIPFDQLDPLLDLTCCEWWSMQDSIPVTRLRHPYLREPFEDRSGSLSDLAAAIQNLDLLITVDTLAAHIAGALGTAVWVLLKKHADWRWMQDRSDSPWYPSMRLFRQQEYGDWPGVLSAVQTELRTFCTER